MNDPAFVDRRRELALLWDRFELTRSGRANVVLINGEAGIGKTRLLAEITAQMDVAGATILKGGASQAEGMPPFLPFREALGDYVRSTPCDRLREQTGARAAILADFLPGLSSCLGELAPPQPVPAEQARLGLYEAVGHFLAAISADAPLVLLLDDLHWADAGSLDLLCYVARHQLTTRLLILGAYREAEASENPALEWALADLARLRILTTVPLAPLTADDVRELAVGILGGPADAAVCQLLYAQSEGNPFFAEELLRDWLEQGAVIRKETGLDPQAMWTLMSRLDRPLPASIAACIRQRLARLPAVVIDQLRVAAVIGRTFSPWLLAQVEGQGPEEVEDYLQVAERARLIGCGEGAAYAFCHDKIRECLYAELSSGRRRRLHEQIGLALEATAGLVSVQQLAELAFHFARSRDRARGVAYSHHAADAFLRAHAPDDATAHYQMALDLMEAEDGQRGQVLLGLGEATLQAADEQRAVAAFEGAEAWFQKEGDLTAAARAAHGRGLACGRLGRRDTAEGALETSRQLLETTEHLSQDLVRVLVDLSSLLGSVPTRHDEAIAYGRRALDNARARGNRRLEGMASRSLGLLLVQENDFSNGMSLLEQALVLAEANDDPAEEAECCACLAQATCWSAQFERSRQFSLRRAALACRCGHTIGLRYVHSWLAFLSAAQGDWLRAEESLAQAESFLEKVSSSAPSAFWRQVRGYLAYQRGEYTLAERELCEATAVSYRQDPGELVPCLGVLSLALLASGQHRQAQAAMAELEAGLAGLPAGHLPALSARACLALVAVGRGDAARASSHYADLLACRGQYHWFLVDRILGEVAALSGDWPAAEAHLADAEAVARREGLRPELGRILVAQADLARVQAGPGSAARARWLMGQAKAIFHEIDLLAQIHVIQQRLRGLPPQPSVAGHRPLPAGLSPREAEVLRLVAAGKSNRQIAHELALSENTVAHHLTSIFNKTGTNNRTAATAFALHNALV